MNVISKWSIRIGLFIAWLGFSVVAGAFVLSLKQKAEIDVFSSTGYHAFKHCITQELNRAVEEKTRGSE